MPVTIPHRKPTRAVSREDRGLPAGHPVAVDLAADASELCPPRGHRRCPTGYPAPLSVLATPQDASPPRGPSDAGDGRNGAGRPARRRLGDVEDAQPAPAGAGDGRTGGGGREAWRRRGGAPRRGVGGRRNSNIITGGTVRMILTSGRNAGPWVTWHHVIYVYRIRRGEILWEENLPPVTV